METDRPAGSVVKKSIRSCAVCRQADPDAALKVLVQHSSEPLVSESHFSLQVLSCATCGGLWLGGFCELIDWDDGDDSQIWFYVPLNQDELEVLRNSDPDHIEKLLVGMRLVRPRIVRDYPTGGAMVVRWIDGPLRIKPHD